jgi:serine/threonine-protein kinase RsbW
VKGLLSLHVKSDIGEIEGMTQEIASWCRKQALSEELELQIDLVLDEIVSNVIRHGLKDEKEHFIDVSLSCDEHELIVQVEDDGVPFNPLENPIPDINKPIEERRVGGLGIHLVRQIMGTLAYERRDGKNCLFIKKRRGEET